MTFAVISTYHTNTPAARVWPVYPGRYITLVNSFNPFIGQTKMYGFDGTHFSTNPTLLAKINQECGLIFNQPHDMGRAALDTNTAPITFKYIYLRYHIFILLYNRIPIL
jgi:hypothetical protein